MTASSRRRATATALAIAAITAGSVATLPAAAEPAAGAAPAAAAGPAAAGLAPVTTALRLVTGERVQLTRGGDGKYTARQDGSGPRYGALPEEPPLRFRSIRTANGPTTISAVPAADAALVASGAVDPHLFDLTYLAAHGATDAVPVVVRFAGATSAARTAAAADALPGATYVAGSATPDRATVSVRPDTAGRFWSAVTRIRPFDASTRAGAVWRANPSAPRELRSRFAALSLAGAPAAARPATTATYHLSVTIVGFSDHSRWVLPDQAMSFIFAELEGVTGPDAAQLVSPSSVTCDHVSPCARLTVGFDAPAGSYLFGSDVVVARSSRFTDVFGYLPQVTLTHDLDLTVESNDASYTTLSSSKVTEPGWYSAASVRVLPDGSQISDGIGLGAANTDYGPGAYLVATHDPVTDGSWHFNLNQVDQQPLVRMTIPGAPDVALTPQYQHGAGSVDQVEAYVRGMPMYRFPAGSHRYRVLDAGAGEDADYAGRDFTGRIAIVRVATQGLDPCDVRLSQVQAAYDAHAAGIVFDPTNLDTPQGHCLVPLFAGWAPADTEAPVVDVPPLPFVTVAPEQAAALESRVRAGAVSIDVTSVDNPTYFVTKASTFQGAIPASVAQTVSDATTLTRVNHWHAPQSPGYNDILVDFTGWRGTDNFAVGTVMGDYTPNAGPMTTTEYVDRPNPDTIIWQSVSFGANSYGAQDYVGPRDPRRQVVDYGAGPFSYGPQAGLIDYDAAVNTVAQTGCNMCRQGDKLFLYADGATDNDPTGGGGDRTLLIDNATATIGGRPVPTDDYGAWILPARRARVVVHVDGAYQDVTWSFTSARPTARNVPDTRVCLAAYLGYDGVCAADPVVFARYRTDGDDYDRQAPGTHVLRVVGYHQSRTAPAITAATVSVSFNGGASWQPASVAAAGGGRFDATYTVPPTARTDGWVSYRVDVTDAAGNTLHQVITHGVGVFG